MLSKFWWQNLYFMAIAYSSQIFLSFNFECARNKQISFSFDFWSTAKRMIHNRGYWHSIWERSNGFDQSINICWGLLPISDFWKWQKTLAKDLDKIEFRGKWFDRQTTEKICWQTIRFVFQKKNYNCFLTQVRLAQIWNWKLN